MDTSDKSARADSSSRSTKPLFAAAFSAPSRPENPKSSVKDISWTNIGSSFKPLQNEPREQGKSTHRSPDVSSSRVASTSSRSSSHHHRSKKHRHSPDRKKHHDSSSRASSSSSRSHLSKKTFRQETGLSSDVAFRVDRNGDGNNLAFDELYRLHVPFYNKRDCIDHTGLSKRSLSDKREEKNRYYSRDSCDRPVKQIKPAEPKGRTFTLSEYIPLVSSDEEDDIERSNTSLEGEITFRSLGEKVSKNTAQPSRKQQLYDETQHFNEYLRENPHDIDKWLKFIKFQDKIFDRSMDKNENLTASLIEKKLSILEKAIESNPRCIELLIERLNLVKFVWEDERVNNEWKKLTFLYANNCRVWREYICFLKSCTSYFSTSKVINVYMKIFSTLNNILHGQFHTHKADDALEMELVKLFSDYCTFLYDTGYTERSIASWQAIIEFNFFSPSNKYDTSELTTFFEPFWDSGAPRIGESNALGWDQTIKMKQVADCTLFDKIYQDLEKTEEKISVDAKSVSDLWLQLERVREASFWLPVRGSALESLEDPYQSVLFDDIKFCLLQVDSSEGKKCLTESFFSHLYRVDGECAALSSDHEGCLQMMHSSIDLLSSRHSNLTSGLLLSYCRHLYSRCKDELQMKMSQKYLKSLLQSVTGDAIASASVHIYIGKLIGKMNESKCIALEYLDEHLIKIIETTIDRISDTVSLVPCILEYCLMKLGIANVNEITVEKKRVNSPCDENCKETVKRLIVASVMQSAQYMWPSFVVTAPLILKTTRKLSDLSKKGTLSWILCYAIFTLVTKGHRQCDSIVCELLPLITRESERESLVLFRCNIYLYHSLLSFGPLRQVRQLLKQSVTQYPRNACLFDLLTAVESTFASVASCTGHFFSESSRDTNLTCQEYYWLSYITYQRRRLATLEQSSRCTLPSGK